MNYIGLANSVEALKCATHDFSTAFDLLHRFTLTLPGRKDPISLFAEKGEKALSIVRLLSDFVNEVGLPAMEALAKLRADEELSQWTEEYGHLCGL